LCTVIPVILLLLYAKGVSIFLQVFGIYKDEIPNTVKEVDTSAFSNSKNLQSIKIPNTVETLGNCAFEGCSKLKSVR